MSAYVVRMCIVVHFMVLIDHLKNFVIYVFVLDE